MSKESGESRKEGWMEAMESSKRIKAAEWGAMIKPVESVKPIKSVKFIEVIKPVKAAEIVKTAKVVISRSTHRSHHYTHGNGKKKGS